MKYNHSLDYVALGIAALRAGQSEEATKNFMAAAYHADAPAAVRIIELSNEHAMTTAKAKVAAAAKAKAEAKAKEDAGMKTNASARLKANEETTEEEVTENDEDGDGVADMNPADGDADVAEIDDTEDFSSQFAAVMASMVKKANKK